MAPSLEKKITIVAIVEFERGDCLLFYFIPSIYVLVIGEAVNERADLSVKMSQLHVLIDIQLAFQATARSTRQI
jgi:hypothetical protein